MVQWIAATKDGKYHYEEANDDWSAIKDDVASLCFVDRTGNHGKAQFIELPDGMDSYNQAKTASMIVGSNKIEIESRFIECKKGNIITRVRVDEKTNNISIEIDES